MSGQHSITLEEKLKAIREVESIYALAKKWQRLTPDEKRPNWERIADAVLQKLVMEGFIGSIPPAEQIIPVQYNEGNSYDCLIGEKMWAQRSQDWNMP